MASTDSTEGPFYFAWADANETVFGPEHEIEDEEVESFEIVHSEGDSATLSIVVKNPREGPLAAGRLQWAWLSWENGTDVDPLFFGEVIAVATDLEGDKATFTFRACPVDFFEQQQRIADGMKVLPFYDEVFLDLSQREDVNVVLETYAARWHCDRVTHVVTTSGITQGEDVTEVFTAAEVPHDSVIKEMLQTPLMSVGVDATVTWQQKTKGIVDFGSRTIFSYAGDGIISEWPRPGARLQGGWTVLLGTALDAYGAGSAITASWSFNWQNKAKKHANGDTMSISHSVTEPQVRFGTSGELTRVIQVGYLNPFATDEEGDPAPINIPASYSITYMIVPIWKVVTTLVMQYDADRARSERVMFVVYADLQEMIGSGLNPQEGEEMISFSDAEVGEPILRLASWYSVRNTAVTLGTIIFPFYEGFPGLKTAQIVTVAGTTGLEHPTFSPILGDLTVDGGATWSSLGSVSPDTTARNWEGERITQSGTMILPSVGLVIPYHMLVAPGLVQSPSVGVSVNEGLITRGGNGSYHVCKLAGQTFGRGWGRSVQLPDDYEGIPYFELFARANQPNWPTTWGTETIDGSVTWFCLGMTLPDGNSYHLCTDAGTTGEFLPPFSNSLGGTTSDGDAVWTNVGASEIPVGGVPGDIKRSHYFPIDRGIESIEYLVLRARAKLLSSARAVKVTFDCAFERAVNLSCRMNAVLQDPHLPGGQAAGKIIEYKIRGGGDGVMRGTVTIGCTIGRGNAVVVNAGDPVYAAPGYMQLGYQQMIGESISIPEVGDVGYSKPIAATTDDGLVFPLTRAQVLETERIHGSLGEQRGAVSRVIAAAAAAAQFGQIQAQTRQQAIEQQQGAAAASQITLGGELKNSPIWYELTIKPVAERSFAALYSIETSDLVAPRHIDLEAAA